MKLRIGGLLIVSVLGLGGWGAWKLAPDRKSVV